MKGGLFKKAKKPQTKHKPHKPHYLKKNLSEIFWKICIACCLVKWLPSCHQLLELGLSEEQGTCRTIAFILMPTGSLPGSCALHQFLTICVPFDALGFFFLPFLSFRLTFAL